MGWVDMPFLAFDTETTGVDRETDHILSAGFVHIDQQGKVLSATEYINPGVPIPPESIGVHGLTERFIQENGGPPGEVLEGICLVLAAELNQRDVVLVGMNLAYDLTILDRNCRRHGVKPLADRCDMAPVVDTLVLDKLVDPYRKGKGSRRLSALCDLYRVAAVGAHNAECDALAAARVAWRIGKMYPPLGELSPPQVHRLQVEAKAAQDASMASWLRRQGLDASGCDGAWPWSPPPEPEQEMPLWE